MNTGGLLTGKKKEVERTAPPSPRGDEYVEEQAATAEAGEKVAAAKKAADELERKAKEAAQKAEAGAKAAAGLEEMWKKATGGGEVKKSLLRGARNKKTWLCMRC
jgi:hypothetical protein